MGQPAMAESLESDVIMLGELDMNTETESEDGGVALSSFESSEMEIDHDSAPTSASQSPIQSAALFANTLGNISPSVAEGPAPFGPSPTHAMETPNLSMAFPHLSHLQESVAHTPLVGLVPANISSFAEALSGELLSVPQGSGFLWDEDATDPSTEIIGTSSAFPTSSAIQPHMSAVQGSAVQGYTSLGAATSEQLQSTHQHVPDMDASVLPDVHHDPDLSLPSLSDVFGSEFLTQTIGSSPNQLADAAAELVNEEWAESWDEGEDSVRNLQCDAFFNHWKHMYAHNALGYPRISDLASHIQKVQRPDMITKEDLDPDDPDRHDFQGIYWSRLQTTKKDAREVRRMTYKNHLNFTYHSPRLYTNLGPFGSPGYKARFSDKALPGSDKFFHFEEMNMRFKSYISHFQLRHNIFASSKNALFYNYRPRTNYGYGAYIDPINSRCDAKIMSFNTETSTDECVMDFTKAIEKGAPRVIRPSTLTAEAGVLVVGSFEGVYAMKSLAANFESRPSTGVITKNGDNGSTNHIQNFHDRRSGLPQAAFSSNDMTIRVLDCTIEKFVRTHHFPYQVNCSAISPDGRLRLLVGDDCDPIVADAETGELLARLPGHTNFGFACAWAPDGITVATGAQDGFVQVWDARNLSQSLQTIPMEMAGSRTLQFSPLGSGKRVLVIAEPVDFVHVVDAQTFERKQTIEFFGEIAGISMPPDGSRLYVANQDETYGGLMEFERSWGSGYRRPRRRRGSAVGEEREDTTDLPSHAESYSKIRQEYKRSMISNLDWLPDDELDDDARVVLSWPHRSGLGLLSNDVAQ